MICWAALALLVGTVSLVVVATVPEVPVSVEVPGRNAAFNAELERLMEGAEAADRAVLDEAITEINRYLDSKEGNLEPFLDDIYSLGSKLKMAWYLAKDIRFKPIVDEYDSDLYSMALLLPFRPVREGSHLPDFIEELFGRYFGSRSDISKMLDRVTGSVSRELAFNNEHLANDIGALAAVEEQGLEQAAAAAGSRAGFHDRAGALAMTIVNHTTGIQLGSEFFSIFVADSIAAYIISYLVAEGVIVIGGLAKGLVTFGIAAVVAMAVDLVANQLAKNQLRPKIEEALRKRRQETVSAFRRQLQQALRSYQMNRRRTVRQLLAG
jgi:hypothetical protein